MKKTAMELGSVATNTISTVDAELKGRGHNKLTEQKIIDIQHVTLNDTTHLIKLYMSVGTKLVLPKGDMTWYIMIASFWSKEPIAVFQLAYHMAEIHSYPLYSKIVTNQNV